MNKNSKYKNLNRVIQIYNLILMVCRIKMIKLNSNCKIYKYKKIKMNKYDNNEILIRINKYQNKYKLKNNKIKK